MPENKPSAWFCSAECARRAWNRGKTRSKKKPPAPAPPVPVQHPDRAMTISEVVRWIQRYEKRTGKLLSYGRAVPLIEAEQQDKAEKKRRSTQRDPRR